MGPVSRKYVCMCRETPRHPTKLQPPLLGLLLTEVSYSCYYNVAARQRKRWHSGRVQYLLVLLHKKKQRQEKK